MLCLLDSALADLGVTEALYETGLGAKDALAEGLADAFTEGWAEALGDGVLTTYYFSSFLIALLLAFFPTFFLGALTTFLDSILLLF